jgi:hypothetical protein
MLLLQGARWFIQHKGSHLLRKGRQRLLIQQEQVLETKYCILQLLKGPG